MEFSTLVSERRSVKNYDPTVKISDAELSALFEHVVLTPSAFNLQHWGFVVARDPELKSAMQELAWGQAQVGDSAAAILVTGKLDAHEDAAAIFEEAPENIRNRMVPMIDGFYAGKEQLMRDEAFRSASMAAMTLMLAAKDQGYETGPMIGFDQAGMAKLLRLPENHVPVMLIVLGKGTAPERDRAYRRPLDEVVKLDYFDGAGLTDNLAAAR